MTAHRREALALEALHRLSKRYSAAVNRSLAYQGPHERPHMMSVADRRKLGDWFEARYNYFQEEYRKAINDNESIIAGKQWLYDLRPRLIAPTVNDRLPSR